MQLLTQTQIIENKTRILINYNIQSLKLINRKNDEKDKKHRDSQMLKVLYDDWGNWARMNNEELRLFHIDIVRQMCDFFEYFPWVK